MTAEQTTHDASVLPADDICRRARLSRDARFDGVFFTAVKTTGIFCRPVCSVAPPLEKNVIYLASAAEAFRQGFRPCLRCRPETAPTSAAWLGSEAIAGRILRAINQGQLQHFSVVQMADRMGISERYLRKLCLQYAGASPIHLEQARRSLFAKQLLFDSNLKITDIAFAAGYQSVRRFNEHWKKLFGVAPNQMRKQQGSAESGDKQQIEMILKVPADYDFDGLLAFFRLRQIVSIERVDDCSYRRCIHLINGEVTELQIRFNRSKKQLLILLENKALTSLSEIITLIKRLFDADAPTARIMADLNQHQVLTRAFDGLPLKDLRLPGTVTPFEAVVRAIVGQQVSVKAAVTILNRILQRLYSENCAYELKPFPTPKQLSGFDFDGLGLPQSRIDTLTAVIHCFNEQPELFTQNADSEIRRQTLLAIKGIGPWTVNYLDMRAYAMPDAFPAGDLIVRQGYAQLTGREKVPTEKQMNQISQSWRPWRAYATLLLWQFYSLKAGEK